MGLTWFECVVISVSLAYGLIRLFAEPINDLMEWIFR